MGSSVSDRIPDGNDLITPRLDSRRLPLERTTPLPGEAARLKETTFEVADAGAKPPGERLFALSVPLQTFEASTPGGKMGDVFDFFDKRFNELQKKDGTRGDGRRSDTTPDTRIDKSSDSKPDARTRPGSLGARDLADLSTFFVLDKKPSDLGGKLTPPVQLIDDKKQAPLEIRDGQGRLIAKDFNKWSLTLDPQSGDIKQIKYPDGKVRNVTQETDGAGKKTLTKVETIEKGPGGQPIKRVLERDKDTKKWFTVIDGVRAELPGEIQFSNDGVLSFQMDNNGNWRIERPDGTVAQERTNASGARIALNEDSTIKQVTRPDQSRLECGYTKRDTKEGSKPELTTVTEISKDGKSVVWTKQGERWLSDGKPPQERKNFEVSENGNISYLGADNVKHIITGGGMELNQNPNGSEFQFDKEGRFTDLKDVNGLRINGIKYNDQTGQVTRAQIGSAAGGRIYNYERIGTSNDWTYTVTDGSGNVVSRDTWHGDIKVGKDGSYAYNESPVHGRNKDGLWRVFKLDGTQSLVQEDGNGNKAVFDTNRNLLSIQRKNGSGLEITRVAGQPTAMVETKPNGEKINYRFDAATNSFIPDKADARAIKKLEADGKGTLKITDINGTLYFTKLDGSSTVKTADGATAEVDSQGKVLRTSSKNGDLVRTFNYDDKGKLTSVTEVKKNGESRTFTGKDMVANADGSFRFTDAEGHKLGSTADGSWQMWQTIKGKDCLMKTVRPNGSYRTIVRDGDGEATAIVDTKRSSDGKETSEIWNRVQDAGKWTDSYAKVSKEGKVESRHGVQLLDNGDYNYVDSQGKDKVGKIGDRGGENGWSSSVEEARERLVERMESQLDEGQRKRFQVMLDRFEKRAKERVEAQVAGGLDQDKSNEEWDKKVQLAYDNLANMLDPNASGATYDLKTRARLVECMAYSMACPVKTDDQGNWGCCWQISGVYAGIIQHPDKMCAMLSQLSTKGTFTDTNGKTWTPPKHLLQFTNQGNSWTIANCGRMAQRSPVAEILTSTAAYLSADGRRMDRGAGGGTPDACNHAMKLITGDTFVVTSERAMTTKRMQQELLRKGTYICIMPGHMYLAALEKHGNEWQLVSSLQHGDQGRHVNGVVTDLRNWTVQGRRGGYQPDINIPEAKNDAIGPNRPNGPNGPWRPRGPYQPYQPYSPDYSPGWRDDGWWGRFRDRSVAEEEWRVHQQKLRAEQEEADKRRARERQELEDFETGDANLETAGSKRGKRQRLRNAG